MKSALYLTGLLVWAISLFFALEILLGQIDCVVADASPKVFIVACGVREVGR